MTILRIFDPALCCSTGVCGPAIDPELARFAADVDWLQRQGVVIERYNLAQQPAAFAARPAVRAALERGTEVLPLVLVDERVAAQGVYPSRETLAALAGVVVQPAGAASAPSATSSSCCAPAADKLPGTGCC